VRKGIEEKGLDSRNRLLTGAAALGVLAVLLHRALAAHEQVFWLSVLFLGALAVISESLGGDLRGGNSRTTYGIIPLTAAILALNTLSAVLVALCAGVSLRDVRKRRSPWAMAFNGLQYALAVSAASFVYHALGGTTRSFELGKTLRSIPFLLLAMAAFWAVNAALVSLAVHWEHGVRPLYFLRGEALPMLPHQLAYGLLGMALGVIYAQNAFHLVYLEIETGALVEGLAEVKANPSAYAPYVLGSPGEALRGFAASVMYLATLGVAWSFSRRNLELLRAYDRTTEHLCAYLEEREPYLRGHASRVAGYAQLLAARLGMSSYDRKKLRYAALLHDLGKVAVPREILLQKVSLSEEEFLAVQRHALAGSNWLEEIPYLADTAGAVLHHHEYFDGGGYPDGIAGDTIPPAARILAVADAYDAMLNQRPWREAKTPEAAAAELRQNSGVQFDPEMVKLFLEALQEGKAGIAAPPAEAEAATSGAPEDEGRERGWQPEDRERPLRKARMGRRRQQLLEERRKRREAVLKPREAVDEKGERPDDGGGGREAYGEDAPSAAEADAAERPSESGGEED